jgi:activating signal cointegrator 1
MKAATLHQPWASLMALRFKGVETRDKYTSHRGPLAIHAARTWHPDGQAFLNEVVLPMFPELKDYQWPLGVVIAKVNLVDCVKADSADQIEGWIYEPPLGWDKEKVFGNYARGRWAILTQFIEEVNPPIPARGMPSFVWEWKDA